MIPFLIGLLTCLGAFFRSRYNLGLEILALRQQLGVLKRKHPRSAPTAVWSSVTRPSEISDL